jgi:hypothetical protein
MLCFLVPVIKEEGKNSKNGILLSPLSLENRIDAMLFSTSNQVRRKKNSKNGILLSPLSLGSRINAKFFSISNQGKSKKNQ